MISSLAQHRAKKQARDILSQIDEALDAPNPISEISRILDMDTQALGIQTFEEFIQVVQVRCSDLNRIIDPNFVPRCPEPSHLFYDDLA